MSSSATYELIKTKPVPSRPPKLNARRRVALESILLRGAEVAGHDAAVTCASVADVIQRAFRCAISR